MTPSQIRFHAVSPRARSVWVGAWIALIAIGLFTNGCGPISNNPIPGPDKQGTGTVYGAMLGAGTGAVTGAQLSAGTGPGAMVGAGLGAVWGAVNGFGIDLLEEDQLRREEELARARELAWVQDVLAEHYKRRMELHPNRDIFPADLFFESDSSKLTGPSISLVHELALLTQRRLPWSRIIITAYVTAKDADSKYAQFLTNRRAEEIATQFVRAGVEARRVQARGVTLQEPLVRDPLDHPSRYKQAVEIVTVDN